MILFDINKLFNVSRCLKLIVNVFIIISNAEFSEMLSSVMGKDQSSSPIPMTSGKDTNLHQMMSESESSTSSASHELNLYSFWTKTNLFRALVLGCSIQACQQLVGINTVMYYSATIMRQAGFDSRSAIW